MSVRYSNFKFVSEYIILSQEADMDGSLVKPQFVLMAGGYLPEPMSSLLPETMIESYGETLWKCGTKGGRSGLKARGGGRSDIII